jgi:hypothetical protein
VRDVAPRTRYGFGLKTADFLICARCGIFVGTMVEDTRGAWAIVNANTLDEVAQLTQPATKMSYDGETEAQRMARRRERWTPAQRSIM